MGLNSDKYKSLVIKSILFISIFLLSGHFILAQHSDAQLALKYYQNKEFDKAAVLYEKLYSDTGFKNHRDYYLRCLDELNDYETAEKFLKKEMRRNRNDFYMMIDLGMVYLRTGRVEVSEEMFEKALELAVVGRNNIIAAANSFQMYRNYKWAEKVYLEGSKKTRENFDYELGNIYFMQRDYEKMMRSYITDLKRSPQRLSIIQNRLQHIMSRDIDQGFDDIIEKELLIEVQKNPQYSVLNQLLIWQFTQVGKFEAALTQLIAIDRRSKTDGIEILEFGNVLKNNAEYELALRAFSYITDQGETHPAYSMAYIQYLNVLFEKNTRKLEPDIREIAELEEMLEEALNIVRRRDAFSVIYALAQIKAFYLSKYQEAIQLLSLEIDNKRLNPADESTAKLLLGDIYMLNDNPWEATLLYAQVEKANPESPIGHEARFKRARLAYYTGEFEWAQAQLQILKGSTSKLIANDALELSVFISDNFNLDTTETTMQMFAQADFYIFTRQYSIALELLQTIQNEYPSHKLIDDILYRKASIYEKTDNLVIAAELYNQIVTDHYFDILADKALFRYALIQEKLNNNELAEEAYFKIITDFPGSVFTVEARNNLRNMRDKNLIN
jgi:tetratricopeptide (TPR) repeat protein